MCPRKNRCFALRMCGSNQLRMGDCVQILHVGPYDDEPESFMKVEEFCSANKLQRINDEWHREIYLSDARKVESAKLKTVLRMQVKSM